ncbi:MAG: efflux RND transporter periplasmic adaptor subunit, partial [Bacteroidota bacterium]
KIEITNATKSIKSGMAANITFDFSNGGGQLLVVPAKSVGEDSKGRFVFLVDDKGDKTGIVKKHHIEVGKLKPDGFEVTSGLSIGQKIAVAGLQTLLDGQEVKLQQ